MTNAARSSGLGVKDCSWINILEDPLEEDGEVSYRKEGDGVVVDLDFRCFEIKTLKVSLG